VDAEGRLVVASPDQNPELLAALCGGGGGNFGELATHGCAGLLGWAGGGAKASLQSLWLTEHRTA
jgi:hypothetical protein